MARLSPHVLRTGSRFQIAPYIVQANPGQGKEALDEVDEFDCFNSLSESGPLGLLNMGVDTTTFLSQKLYIPTFSMFTAILPREALPVLTKSDSIRALYVDDILYGTQRPTVPDAGMFLMRTKTSDKFMFTSTVHTKRLMGGYDANELGFKGDGMTVAVVDTGGSRFHEQTPHLEFDNTLIGQIADHQGHGQWCASCVGGKFAEDYALSREAGKAVECEGFVPQARLVGIKSLGFGIGAGSTSSIIKGVELAMTKYEADVISMSLGGTCSVTSEQDDPFKAVMEGVVAKGVIPVVAAGNEGSGAKTVGSPGWIEEVLTVGAYDPISGAVAGFSSRGPTVDGRTKPDCTAPGVNIDSGILGMLDNAGDQKRNRYSPISGTSMATPHVSGLVTLMAECHLKTIGARLTVAEVKDMLRTLGGGKNNDDGWGPISWGMYRNWLRKIYGVEI